MLFLHEGASENTRNNVCHALFLLCIYNCKVLSRLKSTQVPLWWSSVSITMWSVRRWCVKEKKHKEEEKRTLNKQPPTLYFAMLHPLINIALRVLFDTLQLLSHLTTIVIRYMSSDIKDVKYYRGNYFVEIVDHFFSWQRIQVFPKCITYWCWLWLTHQCTFSL